MTSQLDYYCRFIEPLEWIDMSIVIEPQVAASQASDEVKVEPQKPEYVEIDAQPVLLTQGFVKIDIGGGLYKDVTYEDFIKILSESAGSSFAKTEHELLLPKGVFYMAMGNDAINISCYYEESVRPFSYQRDSGTKPESFNIITPNIIISHQLKKEKDKEWVISNSSRYLATDQPINKLPKGFIHGTNPGARIVLMPFTNAYRDCKMCFGDNKMPMRFTDNNLRGLDYYYAFLWNSPFNNDLGIEDKLPNFRVRDWYYHLKACADEKKGFPYSELYHLGK